MKNSLRIALLLGLVISTVGCETERTPVTTPDTPAPEIIGGEPAANDSSGEAGE